MIIHAKITLLDQVDIRIMSSRELQLKEDASVVAFHNRNAVHENEPPIHCCLLNSRSHWVMHLRHRNFTVQGLELQCLLKLVLVFQDAKNNVSKIVSFFSVDHNDIFDHKYCIYCMVKYQNLT